MYALTRRERVVRNYAGAILNSDSVIAAAGRGLPHRANLDSKTIVMSEPLFDPSLKKRSKKKQVAFSEDPLGADADPTAPAPILDDTTVNGDAVDLGPKTVHEQMKQNEVGIDDAASEIKENKEEDDFKAMFGDLKKKKKKKEIPLELVCCSPSF